MNTHIHQAAHTPDQFTFRVELANKIGTDCSAIGNLWAVSKYLPDGRRFACWALEPQECEQVARDFVAARAA